MAKFDEFIEQLGITKIIPMVAISNPEHAVPLSKAFIEGGINWIEVTFRNKNASESLMNIKNSGLPIHYGAGTVRTIEQAKQAISAEVEFIVTPGFNEQVVQYILDNSDIPIMPGVDSTIGIENAVGLGLTYLKLFPASVVGGINWLKAVNAPYYDVKFIPTGGVNLDNMLDYLNMPNVVGCGGSFLAPNNLIENKKWNEITNICKKAVEILHPKMVMSE